MTTAWWDFRRSVNAPLLTVHLVTGGHPDQWLHMLATWRVTEPPPQDHTNRPPPTSKRSRKQTGDHRWLETVISAVTRDLVPTIGYARPPEDGTVRGVLVGEWQSDPETEWRYMVVGYPTSVVITHVPTHDVRYDFTKRANAWGILKARAEEAGDANEVERTGYEEMLAALAGK